VGRKIGFTNVTIWERYGVHQPMWAHTFAHTVHFAPQAKAALSLAGFVQPRIEPEVVFQAEGAGHDDAPETLIRAIEWIAPGFEIVAKPFSELEVHRR
jgi:2-oxo-3-hexenedioate decarboxylase